MIANNAVDSGWGHKPDTPISSRLVVMRLVLPVGGAPRHVEYRIDHTFIDRLRQLRTLVPMITSLNRQRDLVIDKVRVRLPSAVWRRVDAGIRVSGSSLVVSNEGIFHLGAKDVDNGHKLLTCTFPISRLIDLHAQRPAGETLYIQSGFFINDEPAETEAGRWVAAVHAIEEGGMVIPEGASDFDTLHGVPARPDLNLARAA